MLMADITGSSILLCFGRTDLTIAELKAMEGSRYYEQHPKRDELITAEDQPKIAALYHSQEVKFAKDGDFLDLSKMTVKIAHFGKARSMECRRSMCRRG